MGWVGCLVDGGGAVVVRRPAVQSESRGRRVKFEVSSRAGCFFCGIFELQNFSIPECAPFPPHPKLLSSLARALPHSRGLVRLSARKPWLRGARAVTRCTRRRAAAAATTIRAPTAATATTAAPVSCAAGRAARSSRRMPRAAGSHRSVRNLARRRLVSGGEAFGDALYTTLHDR